jgi:hypothetical protein
MARQSKEIDHEEVIRILSQISRKAGDLKQLSFIHIPRPHKMYSLYSKRELSPEQKISASLQIEDFFTPYKIEVYSSSPDGVLDQEVVGNIPLSIFDDYYQKKIHHIEEEELPTIEQLSTIIRLNYCKTHCSETNIPPSLKLILNHGSKIICDNYDGLFDNLNLQESPLALEKIIEQTIAPIIRPALFKKQIQEGVNDELPKTSIKIIMGYLGSKERFRDGSTNDSDSEEKADGVEKLSVTKLSQSADEIEKNK